MGAGISITYGDFAPDAKETFVPTTDDKASFVDMAELQQYNLAVKDYGNPCEQYLVPLDGSMLLFPDDPETEDMGWWSESVTDADGDFSVPIVLRLDADGAQFSAQGFTFTFDTKNGIFPNSINIKWYRAGELLEDEDFTPDSAFYFCQKQVNNFDAAEITFNSLNMPHNRLKVRSIDYGYGTEFSAAELRNVKVIQQIDPISSEISINTVDFTLESHSDINYSFQQRQPITVRFNDNMIATTFVRSSTRKAARLWSIQSEDYIGVMADTPFVGGMYKNKDVATLFSEIFAAAKVPYNSDAVASLFSGETVTGWIPYTDCRTALMLVAMACRAVIDTTGSAIVKVFRLSNTVSQFIGLERIRQGQSFSGESTVTAVEVTAHEYTESAETVQAYTAAESGAGANILVKFSEPLHDLTITNGTIHSSGVNYAVITANNSNCVLSGKKYDHAERVYRYANPVVLLSETENVKSISNSATLISPDNAAAVLAHVADWLTRIDSVSLRIIDGKHVTGGNFVIYGNGLKYGETGYGAFAPETATYDTPVMVGDYITIATDYLGEITGRVIQQTYSLIGGITVKDTVLQ